MMTYQTEDGRRVTVPEREPDALGAFMRACEGPDPDVSALDWLSALLNELTTDNTPLRLRESEDPQALSAALSASCRLLRDLRAAEKLAK